MTEITKEQTPAIIRVQAYSLAEALQQAQTGVQQGYTIDLESNEGYPQQFGSMITFTLLKITEEPFPGLGEVVQEDKPTVEAAVLKEVQVKYERQYKRKEK